MADQPPYEPVVDALLAALPRASGFCGELTRDDARQVVAGLSERGYTLWRKMTEADEHYQLGDECDHDGQPWPCPYIRSLAAKQSDAPAHRDGA